MLRHGEYGFLAMVNADGGGYGVPLSYVYEDGIVYFHCAPQGHKLDNLALDDRMTFTVVGATKVICGGFTTAYQSVMLFGRVRLVQDDRERFEALERLGTKYNPGFEEVAKKYIRGSFARTAVLRFDVEAMSAKAKKV